jgi:hypothetical protein
MPKKLLVTFLICLFISLLTSGCQSWQVENNTPQIALYSETGADERCVLATTRMFEWMDYDVTLLNADSINIISLNRFNLICFPGGDMYQYSQQLTDLKRSEHSSGLVVAISESAVEPISQARKSSGREINCL